MRNDQISALERLMKLKESGALTDDEFQAQKEKVLAGETPAGQPMGSQPQASPNIVWQRPPDVPFYRRLWVVIVLALSLIGLPFAFLIILTGTIYKKVDEELVPISPRTKTVLRIIVVIWIIGAILNAIFFPDSTGFLGAIERSLDRVSEVQSGQPASCDSPVAYARAKYKLEHDPSILYAVMQKQVQDIGPGSEDHYDQPENTRYCTAQAVVNGEKTKASYALYFDRNGTPQVTAKIGDNAFGKRQSMQAPTQQSTSPKPVAEVVPPTEGQQVAETSKLPENIPTASGVPACNDREMKLAAAAAYIKREGMAPDQIPESVLAAFTSLKEMTSPDTLKLRQLMIDGGHVNRIEDTRVCHSSEGEPANQGAVYFVRPNSELGGYWMGLGEPILFEK